MRVLVGCEFSGVVRDAFLRAGHDAWSCDLLPCEADPARHLQRDVLTVLADGWDLAVFHPPCTHLAVSGARWFHLKRTEQAESLDFVRRLLDAPIERIALENPVSIIIGSRRRQTDGSYEAERSRESPPRWRTSGANSRRRAEQPTKEGKT